MNHDVNLKLFEYVEGLRTQLDDKDKTICMALEVVAVELHTIDVLRQELDRLVAANKTLVEMNHTLQVQAPD